MRLRLVTQARSVAAPFFLLDQAGYAVVRPLPTPSASYRSDMVAVKHSSTQTKTSLPETRVNLSGPRQHQ